jgi:hypothetical protein
MLAGPLMPSQRWALSWPSSPTLFLLNMSLAPYQAFGLIVRRINDEPFDVPSVPGSRAVTIKFMIPNSRMGSVIGKQGSKIKEIQDASGARLNASEGMLPGSTEVCNQDAPSLLAHPRAVLTSILSGSSVSRESPMPSISPPITSATSSSRHKSGCRPAHTHLTDRQAGDPAVMLVPPMYLAVPVTRTLTCKL